MATGTGNLPYTMSPVSPFDVITSQAENERIANIESLADGTGIGDSAVTTTKIADGAVTAPKIDFTSLGCLYSTGGNVTFSTAGDYTMATVDATNFPTGSKIFCAGTFAMDKSSGTPAVMIAIKYNSAIVGTSITSTATYTTSFYGGWSVIGVATKLAGINSITFVANFDGALVGSGTGSLTAFRIG